MYYVIRQTPKGTWIRESRVIIDHHTASHWKDFIQGQHPKQLVFVVEKKDLKK